MTDHSKEPAASQQPLEAGRVSTDIGGGISSQEGSGTLPRDSARSAAPPTGGDGDRMREEVERVLAKIRPYIQSDGGDISLVSVDGATGIVRVSLHGACGSCPGSTATLKGGVERMLRAEVPGVREVLAA